MDEDGNLTIIELKRDRAPREALAQLLDYASWVSELSTRRVKDIAEKWLKQTLDGVFGERFGKPLPEKLNQEHRMLLVAGELDQTSRRIIEYLSREHQVAINAAFFSVFKHGEHELVAADWLLDQDLVEERAISKVRSAWSGHWYVNVVQDYFGNWDDWVRYGYVAAGGGNKYSAPLQKLEVGATFFAYLKGHGYLGVGVVTEEAQTPRGIEIDGKPLPELVPRSGFLQTDPAMAANVVRVEWLRTVPVDAGKWFKGAFANQNIVCKLRDEGTVSFLRREFGLDDD